jgi:hypothetical protein
MAARVAAAAMAARVAAARAAADAAWAAARAADLDLVAIFEEARQYVGGGRNQK